MQFEGPFDEIPTKEVALKDPMNVECTCSVAPLGWSRRGAIVGAYHRKGCPAREAFDEIAEPNVLLMTTNFYEALRKERAKGNQSPST